MRRKIIVVLLIIAAGLWLQPLRPLVFVGRSMEPTYANWSVTLTVPRPQTLHRGDVVVVRTPSGSIVKRVAYVAGDELTRFENLGMRCDLVSDENLASLGVDGWKSRVTKVPDGCVYVLGDNAADSIDSRQLGFIPVDMIERVVVSPKPAHILNRSIIASLQDTMQFTSNMS